MISAGRVVERIADIDPNVVMEGSALRVVKSFSLDLSHAHQVITSN